MPRRKTSTPRHDRRLVDNTSVAQPARGAEIAWFKHLARLNRSRVSKGDVLRVAASIVTPMAIGISLQQVAATRNAVSAAVLASIGALVGAIAPQAGPTREKMTRTAAGILLGGLGLLVGRFAAGGGWEPVLLLAALGALAALVSAISANFSFGALQFLVYIAVASGLVNTFSVGVRAGFFFAGAAWAMFLTFVEARADPVDHDRAAVAAVFTAIAGLLASSGADQDEVARTSVTQSLNSAYDGVVTSRSQRAGYSPRLAKLAGILNSTSPLSEGAVALYRSQRPADPGDIRAVQELASSVASGRRPSGDPPSRSGDSPALRAIRDGIRQSWSAVSGQTSPAPRRVAPERNWRARVGDLASRTISSADSRGFAIRLALCLGIAEVVREHLPLEKPYWVLLTVAIVLKPDFGSIFARAVQRTVGTVLGVLLGALFLAVVPHDAWMLIPMAVVAAAMPWAQANNYGLFAVFLTPLVVILLDITRPGGGQIVTARLIDTLIGCSIVLVFGYLLWPNTWRAPLDRSVHRTVSALDDFVGAAFTSENPVERRSARRRTFRALTGLQTQFQRLLAEPPPVSRRAAAWWPAIVQLERTADAVIEAVVELRSGAPAPPQSAVSTLRTLIKRIDLPGESLGPEGATTTTYDVLAPIAREAEIAHRLLLGARSSSESRSAMSAGARDAPSVSTGR